MNRENEEQRPVPQTLCGALQKEPNCKCLVLTILIYCCLAAITWCRCANVTKIMINYAKFPIRSTKHVSSPCDEGYIYIPVAFMGLLYLVYLVECYHSPIRIDLLHAEGQDNVLSKLMQLKLAQPRIWWKAVSYHYVRRKRQITRYRNGDNYTTTQICTQWYTTPVRTQKLLFFIMQRSMKSYTFVMDGIYWVSLEKFTTEKFTTVYYERVNTHSATSHYYYDYCGVKDISKELILESKIPITKIMLTKGFAFSNIRSATEFEETRSRFFAEQELSDDYMEMREGLDLGYNVNTMLVAVLDNPWFTNCYVYWCLSALLLSWPLRVIIEYKTQYVDYQVTKLFGVNYDTPICGEPIHASMSQLSQPGSYMLAPSYSEALLMEPTMPRNDGPERDQENWRSQRKVDVTTDMIPSYSEALLYERAEQYNDQNAIMNTGTINVSDPLTAYNMEDSNRQMLSPMPCECHCPCPCHGNTNDFEIRANERNYIEITNNSESSPLNTPLSTNTSDTFESEITTLRTTADGRLHPPKNVILHSVDDLQTGTSPNRCGSCGRISTSTQTINLDVLSQAVMRNKSSGSSQISSSDFPISDLISEKEHRIIPRDISEPNLRSRSELANICPKENIRSLENILENEEEPVGSDRANSVHVETNLPNEKLHAVERRKFLNFLSPSLIHHRSLSLDETSVPMRNAGAIPKTELYNRITMNPMSHEACWKLPNSKTYFCLKSILKQNRRRYTLMTADEFQNFADTDTDQNFEYIDNSGRNKAGHYDGIVNKLGDYSCSKERLNPRRRMPSFEEFISKRDKMYLNDQKQDNNTTLIFASPIQKAFPDDPFGGKDIVPVRNLPIELCNKEDCINNSATRILHPSRSSTVRDARCVPNDYNRERSRISTDLFRPDNTVYPSCGMHPSYRSEKEFHFLRSRYPFDPRVTSVDANSARGEKMPRMYQNNTSLSSYDRHFDRSHENDLTNFYLPNKRHQRAVLTRSFTERRPKVVLSNSNFRRSFTGRIEDYRTENTKRTNFNMETSL